VNGRDLRVDGRIVLKWILKEQEIRVRSEFIWLKIGISDGLSLVFNVVQTSNVIYI
jgi:hypothetical protein